MGIPVSPPPASLVPMGFAAQIKALHDAQKQQNERIAVLENEISAKDVTINEVSEKAEELLARIQTLEENNNILEKRRKEAVAQLITLRTSHQEANAAFQQRASTIQPDDLESMLVAHSTTVNIVMNHHGRVLRQPRGAPRGQQYQNLPPRPPAPFSTPGPGFKAPYQIPITYAYPLPYDNYGFCRTHCTPYPCCVCGL